jgi:hypothetical protein
MVQKIPPPPFIASLSQEMQSLNRWLLEIQAILNSAGTVDPGQVDGLPEVIAQTALNTSNIDALQVSVGDATNSIALLSAQIVTIQTDIATINGTLTTLGARAQVFNGTGAPAAGLGTDNDWYYNRTGAVGARLYIKLAGVWTAQAI